uniref:Uncharacterized protein n=1 Tax=Timema monikensis TaxID=170555 RepID=A0A7R9EBI7_9NEOP|nr:unnamed protein product [Timema monikensis]
MCSTIRSDEIIHVLWKHNPQVWSSKAREGFLFSSRRKCNRPTYWPLDITQSVDPSTVCVTSYVDLQQKEGARQGAVIQHTRCTINRPKCLPNPQNNDNGRTLHDGLVDVTARQRHSQDKGQTLDMGTITSLK